MDCFKFTNGVVFDCLVLLANNRIMATQILVAAKGLAEQEQLLLSLSSDLANNDKPVESRRLAGIMLVEAIAKAGNLWVSMDTVIKSQIKDLLLTTLASIIPGGGGKASFIPGYRKGSLSRNPFKAVA